MTLNFNAICRICLKSGVLKSLYTTARKVDSSNIPCCEMMISCTSVTADENDGLPKHICTKCILNLKTAFTFRKQCEQSFSILVKLHKENLQSQNEDKLVKQEDKAIHLLETENNGEIYADVLELKEELDDELKDELDNQLKDEFDYEYKDDQLPDLNSIQDSVELHLIDPNNDTIEVKDEVDPIQERVYKKLRKRLKKLPIEKAKVIVKPQKAEQILGVDVKTMKNTEGKYQCNQCPKVINHKRSFVRHLERHLGIKSFFCEICQKYYAREWVHMQTHIVHPVIKMYNCKQCDKSYKHQSSLSVHVSSHIKKKPHICDDCGKSFHRLERLTEHKKTHEGIKDYICQFCSKEFSVYKNLIMHIKYKHTNDRRYPCKRCDKRFVTSECLRTHEKRHLGIKKYQCDFCEKRFVTKSAKDCHHKMHTKEKPHACRACGVKFGRTDHRNRHESTAHGMHQSKTLL